MRRVFAKEWLQGRMIPLFGLLMGGLLTALWGIFTVAYVKDWIDQENVNGFCGAMFYIVPVMLAIFVGAGLFAAEVERGTMPLLLALPFSRRQVWVGKTLAGLGLMLSAVVMTIVPGAIATRPALEEVSFWQFLPELALGCALLYFGALFWSTVLGSIVSAFLSAIATGIGLVVWAIVLMVLGGRLFGSPLLDVEVWALAAIPGLIVGSYVGFVRGEAFLGRRRWRMPLAVALAVYLVTMVALAGLARSLTRYDRTKVEKVNAATVTGDGRAVSFLTYGSPVRITREAEAKLYRSGRAGDRRVYSVALDLDTGKELLVRREAGGVEVSPDGKHAVLLTEPRPLTWRGEAWGPSDGPIVEIWDLARNRMTYRGVPMGPRGSGTARIGSVEWSPDGKWIVGTAPEWEASNVRVPLLGLDGRVEREISVLGRYWSYGDPWVFSPDGGAIYAFGEEGVVTRHDLATAESDEAWSAAKAGFSSSDWYLRNPRLAVSPDGRRLAIAATFFPSDRRSRSGPSSWAEALDVLLVASTDGSHSTLVSREPWRRERGVAMEWETTLTWLGDTGALLYLRPYGESGVYHVSALQWREGERTVPSVLQTPMGPWESATLPDGRTLIVAREGAWLLHTDGRFERLSGRVRAAFEDAELAGIDARGRAIVAKAWAEEWGELGAHTHLASYLAAVDMETGEMTRVYP
ncbi:MAG: ABC transporter permease subunit [Armatimonadota bacterium]